MPSSPPKRTGISLFKLPYLVQNEIYANWDFIEIFHFSTLSKRTKSISKSIKKHKLEMHLYPFNDGCQIMLYTRQMGRNRKYWRLRLTGYGMPYKAEDYYQVYMKNSCESFVFIVDHLQDVFEVKIESLQLDIGEEMNEEKMKPFANDHRLYELHGGFNITRADGKIATIGHDGYHLSREDNPREQFEIEECARISIVWNLEQSDEEEEIEDVVEFEEGDEHEVIDRIKQFRRSERRHIFMIVW